MTFIDAQANLGPVPAVPFITNPCLCVKRHSPLPVICELHHIFPKEYQNKIWGAVLDNRTQVLCPNAHFNVHAMIEAVLAGKPVPKSVNKFQRTVALLGVQRIKDAQNGGPKPGEPPPPPPPPPIPTPPPPPAPQGAT